MDSYTCLEIADLCGLCVAQGCISTFCVCVYIILYFHPFNIRWLLKAVFKNSLVFFHL